MKAKPRTSPTVNRYRMAAARKATESAVSDGAERPGEAAVDRLADGSAGADLVLEPLEIDHVGVDGDADRTR